MGRAIKHEVDRNPLNRVLCARSVRLLERLPSPDFPDGALLPHRPSLSKKNRHMLYRLGEWTMTSMQIGVRTYLLAMVAGDFPVMGPHDQRNLAASTVS